MAPPTGLRDNQLRACLRVADVVLGEALVHAVVGVEQPEDLEVVAVDDLEVLARDDHVPVLDPAHRRRGHGVHVARELHVALRVRERVARPLPELGRNCTGRNVGCLFIYFLSQSYICFFHF